MSDDLVSLLRRAFLYDPEIGVVYWKEIVGRFSGNAKIGQRAGTLARNGYVQLWVLGHNLRAHRAIWGMAYGAMPILEIDHINRIRHDNRLCNLRQATRAQNCWNIAHHSRALPKGVSDNGKGTNRFRAEIKVNGKRLSLGFFPTPELAGEAYDNAASAARREFACRELAAPFSFPTS